MKNKHTPGPWTHYKHTDENWYVAGYVKSNNVSMIGSDVRCRIVDVFGSTKLETKANAHLIAAAPDLLEACKIQMRNHYLLRDQYQNTAERRRIWTDIEIKLRLAIAKAEGNL